ncbi:MAG: phosphodiester glycosidase family protein [Sporichthyaceae bacterium]
MTANPTFRPRTVVLAMAAFSLVATGVSVPIDAALGADAPPLPSGPPLDRVPRSAPLEELPVPLPAPAPAPAPAVEEAPRQPKAATAVRRNGVATRLPLGPSSLKESRSTVAVAKGVTLTTVRRGEPRKRGRQGASWVVRALTIDPKVAKGSLGTTYGPSVAGTTPTTKLTREADALVGVNASFFALGSRLPGNPVGLTIDRGRVLSEPSGMKREVTLLVDSAKNSLRIERVKWSAKVRDAGGNHTLRLDKVNAVPRVPSACRTAASQARCESRGQMAAFTAKFGKRTPSGVGTEILLDRDGCAVKVAAKRGLRLGKGRSSIQATGKAARDIEKLVSRGCIDIQHTVRDGKGDRIEIGPATAAVSGRFRLLEEGRVVAPERRDDNFFRRHPRTVVGTAWDGKIVMITVDGRGRSVGATLPEAARVAWAFGLRDAVNLDGGGSTTMSIRGKLVNRVSGGRERAVSDALVWRNER